VSQVFGFAASIWIRPVRHRSWERLSHSDSRRVLGTLRQRGNLLCTVQGNYRLTMIKGITFSRRLSDAAEFHRLASFFGTLGLEPGRCWDISTGEGCRFGAPFGNIELSRASECPQGNSSDELEYFGGKINIEVTSLDSVRQSLEGWLRANPSNSSTTVSEVVGTSWGSRLFIATPVPGFSVMFWEWSHPLKGKPIALEGDLSAKGMRFAIVAARWNAVITDRLLQGSLDALFRSGASKEDVEMFRVPGAWEIPSASRRLAESGKFDAIITLGVLLRGETAHYEAIYTEISRGIGQSQQRRASHMRSVFSPVKPSNKHLTAPVSKQATKALKPPLPPLRWSRCTARSTLVARSRTPMRELQRRVLHARDADTPSSR
jgi:6,7-dimethyl-8-ribityllumazine synthase